MTVAVVITIYDGVILASDSATTMSRWDLSGDTAFLNVYNNAEKVFQLSKTLPVGTVTYGLGNIGRISVGTLFKEVRKRIDGRSRDHPDWTFDPLHYTVRQVAERVIDLIFDEHYGPIAAAGNLAFSFGCKVAGYSAESLQPEVWGVDFKGPMRPQPQLVRNPGECGITCDGEPEAISRLVFGYSQQTVEVLKSVGIPEAHIEQFIVKAGETFKARLIEPPMPMADAADLAQFLVSLSSQFARFRPGNATVGGEAQIASISAEDGFNWIHSVADRRNLTNTSG